MKRFLSMLATLVLVGQSVVTPLVYATDFVNENEETVPVASVETEVADPVSDESDDNEVAADVDNPMDDAEDSAELEESADAEESVKAEDSEAVEESEITEDTETSDVAETEESEEETVAEEPEVKATRVESANVVEKSVSYPAVEFYGHDRPIQVNASAEEGVFPEGTTMKVSLITTSEAEDIAKQELGDAVKTAIGVDISFRDVDGNEIEPKNAQDVHISVSLINKPFVEDIKENNLTVVHQDNDGNTQSIQNVDVDKGYAQAKAEFDHNHFSIFVIALVDFKVINFKNGNTVITGVYLKDVSEASSLIFDPGVELEEGQVFRGWTTNKNYTTETTPQTIDEIKTYVAENFDNLDVYAMIFNRYMVRYHDEGGIVFDTEEVLYKDCGEEICEVEYTINHDYETNNEEFNLLGWKINNEGDSIKNGTPNPLTGDLDLWADVEQGHWLVFDENGRGGTYNAPQFVVTNKVTQEPSLEMKRFGYNFEGWYEAGDVDGSGNAVLDSSGNVVLKDSPFEFGNPLTKKTTIYAKWEPKDKAGYTVIFWTQNLNKDGYEVADSYVNDNGTVGGMIPYTVVENGAEDYVTNVDVYGHYTGFCLTDASKNQKITITPEGDAVLNLYYNRINYNFKFYLYRDGTQRNRYDYANNSGPGEVYAVDNDRGLVTWHNNQTEHPSVNGYTIQSEIINGRTYYYFVMDAFYGEDISQKWPTYDKISGANDREPVSYVMMVGTKLKPTPTNQGSGTVKGVISVLDENILGATNDTGGNYVVVRFPDKSNSWRYHIWFETIDGEDYSDKEVKEYNGKTYYEDTIMEVRSSNTNANDQNEPKYNGFDFIAKKGQNWDANNVNYWITGDQYHLNFLYNREQYKISYFDGQYVDGNGNNILNRADRLLHKSDFISQGATISDEYKNYEAELPEGENGYVFEGWYLDDGCTTPYLFTKMPVGGINVYAKWRQIQYRVFLHPNVPADEGIDWGSDTQKMTFRRSYGDKIDTPTGIRSGYVFVGWYQDAGLTKMFNSDFVLNEDTVKTLYDKTTDFTDPMDKWGNGAETNSDIIGNNGGDRFRITKKFDLYAKWSKVLVGASGVNLVYVDENGNLLWSDDTILYADQSVASALQAPAAPAGKVFESWVVQEWNEGKYVDTEEEVYPGLPFTIDVSKAKFEKNDQCESEEENCNKYVMELRAKYVDEGKPATTRIQYCDGSECTDPETLVVNEEFTFTGALTKVGNEFLGWEDEKGVVHEALSTGYAADNTDSNGTIVENKINKLNAKWKCEGDEHLNEQGQCVDKVEKACTGDIAEGQVATNATGYVRWDDSINDWAEAPVCELVCDEEKGYHDDNGSCVREVERECTPNKEIPEGWKEVSSTGTVAWSGTDWAEAPVCELVCDEEKGYHDDNGACVKEVEKDCKPNDAVDGWIDIPGKVKVSWDDSTKKWAEVTKNCEKACDTTKEYHPDGDNCVKEKVDKCKDPENKDNNAIYTETGSYTRSGNAWEAPECTIVGCEDHYVLNEAKDECVLASYTLTIKYVYADGSDAAATYTNTLNYNEKYEITSPEVPGYTPDVAVVRGIMGDEKVEVTVTYTANEDTAYKVEHYLKDLNVDTYTLTGTDNLSGVTNEVATATQNTYEGFTFDENNKNNVLTGIIAADGRLVLKVYYKRDTHIVTFDETGFVCEYGDTVAVPKEIPTKTGDAQYSYTFAGWQRDDGTVLASGATVVECEDVTYQPTFNSTTNEYLIRFVDEDGTELQSGNVAYGVKPEYNGNTPEKEADTVYTYAFSGWAPEVVEVTGDATYTATYSGTYIDYTVTFDNTGVQCHSGEKVPVPIYIPTKDSDETYTYEFAGWKIVNSEATSQTVTSGDVDCGNIEYESTFKGTYIEYSVKWMDDNTELSGAVYHYNDSIVKLANPTKSGFVFSGWNPTVAEKVTGDATYTAEWKDDKNNNGTADDGEYRTIKYTDGVAEETVFADKVFENQLDGFDTPKYTDNLSGVRRDYVFAGWTPAVAETVSGDATYEATWKDDKNNNGIDDETEKVTLTFNAGDHGNIEGKSSKEIPDLLKDFDNYPEAPVVTPAVEYEFDAWTPAYTSGIKIPLNPITSFTATYKCAADYHDQRLETKTLEEGSVQTNSSADVGEASTADLVCVSNTQEGMACVEGNKPANSHFDSKTGTGTWNGTGYDVACPWSCDSGYTKDGESCKRNGGGGGGGGGSSSSSYKCENLPENAVANNTDKPNRNTDYSYSDDTSKVCTFQCKSGYTRDKDNKKCVKSENPGGGNGGEEEIELGGQVSDKCSVEGFEGSEEEKAAYLYACENDITTIRDINEARLKDFLTRAEMAKMVSVFATKELGMKPNTSKDCSNFANSISTYNQEMKDYMVMSCQLELMGIHTVNYEPIPDFMPSKRVSRAEFGTVLSRVLWGNKYEGTNSNYYINHLNALKENNIITNINPNITEYRAWVFLMLYRAVEAIKVLKSTNNVAIDQQVNEELQEEGKAETGLVVEYDSGSVVPDMAVVTESGTLATGSVAEVGTGSVVEAQSGDTVPLTGDDISKEVSAETGSTAETETGSTSD